MKQRLVGTLVLGCLALIIIPLLLDGGGMDSPGVTTTIPDEPVLSTTPLQAPQRVVIDSDNAPVDAAPVSPEALPLPAYTDASTLTAADKVITDDQDAVPQLGADGLPEAWSVRLGSFGDRANADALLKKLVADGYKAYSRPVVTGQGTLTGIFVGPVITRSEAGKLVKELAGKYQLDGIIVQFQIDELQ